MVTAIDSSGNGNDGTYQGETAFAATLLPSSGDGARNLNPFGRTGVFFNFPTGYVTIPPVAPNWLGPWALECWGRSFEPGFPWYGMLHFSEDGTVFLGNLDWKAASSGGPNDGSLRIDAYGWTTEISDTVTDLFDGNPHHCVATSDGTTVYQYVDGVEVTNIALADQEFASDFPCTEAAIGSQAGTPNFCYGTLDEVAVYDSYLSPARIAAHFAAASASFAAYTSAVLADAPLSYYHLGEESPLGGYLGLVAGPAVSSLFDGGGPSDYRLWAFRW